MRKLFLFITALTLSVGLWAANSIITFTSTSNLYPVDIFELDEDVTRGDGAKWEAFKAQYPEFKDVMGPADLMGITFNPNAFLDANGQVLNYTYNYDDAAKTGTITVNGELVKIARDAFLECTALTSITLPEGVTSIESSAFSDCTALTSVILPESLSSIDIYGFDGCPLSSVTIPANVTYLGYCAFGNNSSLADVYVAWTTTLPTLENNATFSWSPIDNATLHVPVGSLELYQNADVWKNFGSIYDELQETKTAAIAEINAAIEGVTDESILAIATTAKTNISTATTKEGVDAIKAQALVDIDFAKYKADAIAAVNAEISESDNDNVKAIATSAATAINAATTIAEVNALKTLAIANIASAKAAYTAGDAAGYARGKAEGIEEGKAAAKAALPTDPEGTTGHTVTITKDDKTLILVNPDKVTYGKQE